ncbi:unnamed protein product [Calypogeia fissa]
MDGGDGPCANAQHVMKYDLVTLEPCASIARIDEHEFEDEQLISNDGGMLERTLEEGDHFAVISDPDSDGGMGFWILLCTERLHMVEEHSKEDNYGQTVTRGEQLVVGKYYQQQGQSEYSYVLRPQGEAYIYSHLVRAMKFPMTQATHRQRGDIIVYKLDIETHAKLHAMAQEYFEDMMES